MTTIYRDDITGEEYRTERPLETYALIIRGDRWADIDTVDPETAAEVEEVADRLHEFVDEWADDYEQYLKEREDA